ncbi:Rrf2 family transcriptional regulator [Sulfurovum sp.]|uniref:RrF2 family transcriptional regulator n=1 Tax=Sulfurovum sp. TaxID=1969726 RepID=UPI003567D369
MQLQNTSQYAIRILIYLANQNKDCLSTSPELSKTLDIPYKFLTKIMGNLVKAGFVKSIKGREGGYALESSALELPISSVLDTFNDSLHDEQCILGAGYCDNINKCALHDQWMAPKHLIQIMFKETTLEDLLGKGNKK